MQSIPSPFPVLIDLIASKILSQETGSISATSRGDLAASDKNKERYFPEIMGLVFSGLWRINCPRVEGVLDLLDRKGLLPPQVKKAGYYRMELSHLI